MFSFLPVIFPRHPWNLPSLIPTSPISTVDNPIHVPNALGPILSSVAHKTNSSPPPPALNSPKPIPLPPPPRSSSPLAFSMPPLPLLLLLFLSIPLVASQPFDPYILSCRPTLCGGINVTYPFWIPSSTSSPPYSTSFCGYPTFGVLCDNGTLTTLQFDHPYVVLGIDSPNRTISLRDADIGSEPCPKPSSVVVLPPFRYSPDDTNLTFFFNCSSNRIDGSIPCLEEKSYVLRSEEIGGELDGECGEKVVVPVLKETVDGEKDLGKGFAGVLREGFRIKWDPMLVKDCRRCEASGGRCGSRNESGEGLSMICFCNDGTHVTDCWDGGRSRNVKLKVIIAVAALVVCFLLALAAVCVWLKRRQGKVLSGTSRNFLFRSSSVDPSSLVKDPESLGGSYFYTPIFTYEELEVATGGFDSSKELGDGGFGVVYKGVLKDGRVVAVKRLHERNYRQVQQFRNEVEILNRIRHPNLVSLYGCTNRDNRELLLVYEYIPNGTLADHLHGSRASEHLLTWSIRLTIAAETAAALSYLHATVPQIIHRDVKTSNILLDNGFHVKVGDFGISRAFPSPLTTHVSTAPQGTPGYVDPEYHQCYQLTDKSDVYSFGVVLVELVSSKPAVDMDRPRSEINLSNMAMAKIPRGLMHELIDSTLGFDTDTEVRRTIEAVAELAFRCLQPLKDMRPSMDEVRDTLEKLHRGDQRTPPVEGEKHARGDACSLLKSSSGLPPSPDTVVGNWPSRSTFSGGSS